MVSTDVNPNAPFHEQIKNILKQKTSADALLKKAVFPVLISYNSQACSSHQSISQDYIDALTGETKRLEKLFGKRAANLTLKFHLIFVPLNNKKAVIENFDRMLRPYI